jgi:hypothetical protein
MGPITFMGTGDGAWYEGVPGSGIGQSVTIRHDPPQVMRTINLTAGHATSDETHRDNGRIKKALDRDRRPREENRHPSRTRAKARRSRSRRRRWRG